MKKFCALIIMSLFINVAFAQDDDSQPVETTIDGYNSNEGELTEAMEAGEKILLVFGASWCGQCKKMKEDVWAVESFQNFIDDLGVVKFYFDTDEHSILGSEWGVTTIPTWFTLEGETLISKNGSLTLGGVETIIEESYPEEDQQDQEEE